MLGSNNRSKTRFVTWPQQAGSVHGDEVSFSNGAAKPSKTTLLSPGRSRSKCTAGPGRLSLSPSGRRKPVTSSVDPTGSAFGQTRREASGGREGGSGPGPQKTAAENGHTRVHPTLSAWQPPERAASSKSSSANMTVVISFRFLIRPQKPKAKIQ